MLKAFPTHDQKTSIQFIDHVLSELPFNVTIATTPKAGGEIHTAIWAVVADGIGYIRNGFGETFVEGERRHHVTVENIDDEATIRILDAAYKAKSRGPGLAVVISSGTRRYTMNVTPHGAG